MIESLLRAMADAMVRSFCGALCVGLVMAAASARAATIVVDRNDTLDVPGAPGCSLLRAVRLVNAGTDLYATNHECAFSGTLGETDTIQFALGSGTPVVTISEDGVNTFNLPPIVKPVVIDGATGGATRIALAPGGGAAGPALRVQARALLRSLVIGGFSPQQVLAENVDGLRVYGCYLGTDATGSVANGGTGDGLQVIGGFAIDVGERDVPTGRNVISGNGAAGIRIRGSSGVTIDNNYVGVAADGISGLGNCTNASNCAGIVIEEAADGVAIGTFSRPEDSNVISANHGDGIRIDGDGLEADPTGLAAWIAGNFIGLGADGATPLGNNAGPNGAACGVRIFAQDNNGAKFMLGRSARNFIAYNQYCGLIAQQTSPLVATFGDVYFGNGSIGIDLSATANGDGPTANDSHGHVDGPSHWQNFPVLTAAPRSTDGNEVYVSGWISSPNTQSLLIQVYANPIGESQGASVIGQIAPILDAQGNARFWGGPFALPDGETIITATATDGFGTSEFSMPVESSLDYLFFDDFE